MFVNIMDAKKEMKDKLNYEKIYNKTKENENTNTTNTTTDTLTKLIILFLLGATMVALGSIGLVESAKAIASALHISETVVGLTIVAVGTSLPELVTTITSLKKKTSTLGYGNVIDLIRAYSIPYILAESNMAFLLYAPWYKGRM